MTEKLYWQDAYVKEFDATVTKVDNNKIFLDSTAFYPRGGGLVSDVGDMNGVKVLEVVKDGEDVAHVVENNSFQVGQQVHGRIDWEKRHRVMRMHTTAHIVATIINKETGALITGGQIEPDKSRMDFSLENFDREKFMQFIEKANEIVKQSIPVKSYFLKREEAMKIPGVIKLAEAAPPTETDELRIVEITGIDTQADGGVHVANTSEIGKIVVVKIENKGKNNRRLYYTVK